MSDRKKLLEVNYHSDDDTGMYEVGEIDFGVCGTLDQYIEHYGYKGVQEILGALGHLSYEVVKRFHETATDDRNCAQQESTP